MTPILLSGETVKGFLPDATSCVVTEERNGIFELELTYPVAGTMFGELAVDRYIKAKPNDTAALQLFRIYEITKPIAGIVTVKGEHVSYALAHYPVTDVSGRGTAHQAVSAVLAKVNAYLTLSRQFSSMDTGWAASKAYKYLVGSARAALGGSEGSQLDTFGGEYEWDNYTVKLHEHRGHDTGVVVAYRKNMTDLKVTTSLESAYTALFPYAIKDDTVITITEGKLAVQNSSGIADRVMIRDFSSEFQNDETVTAAALKTKAQAWLNANSINAPSVNVTVSFIHLWQSPEYAELAALEKVSLCDWVTVRHEILGVDVEAQVIKTEYDCLAERYNKIELGSARANFQDTLRQTVADVKNLLRTVDVGTSAITQAYSQAIVQATALITSVPGGYVTMFSDSNNKPTEIIVSDKEDYTDATAHVWRWNANGIAFSSTGYAGPYTNAILSDNTIVSGAITSGTINANVITAGILKSANNNSSFNLETGLLTSNNLDVTGGRIRIGDGTTTTELSPGGIYLSTGLMSENGVHSVGGLTPMPSLDEDMNQVYHTEIYYDKSSADGIFLCAHNPITRSEEEDENGILQTSLLFGPKTNIALFTDTYIDLYQSLYGIEIYSYGYFVGDDNGSAKVISYLQNGKAGINCYQIEDVSLIEPNWFGSSQIGTSQTPFSYVFADQLQVGTKIICSGTLQTPASTTYIRLSGGGYATIRNYILGVINGWSGY